MDDLVEVQEKVDFSLSTPDWLTYPEQQRFRSTWESSIRSRLSVINDFQSNNPRVGEIKRYFKESDSKIALLRKPVGIGHQQAELLLSRIPPEDRDAGFDSVILRLKKETDYLSELDEVGISDALLEGLDQGKYKAWVKFISPDSFYARGMQKRGSVGRYIPTFDMVIIPQKAPTSEDMWLMLATEGTLPRVVSDLDHELSHDLQWGKFQRTAIIGLSSVPSVSYFWLLKTYGVLTALGLSNAAGILSSRIVKNFDNDTLLAETHSYNASVSSATNSDKSLDGGLETAIHILESYKLKDRSLMDALYAYNLIYSMRMLRADDAELGKLVSMAKFDKKERNYPRLEKALSEKALEWGVDNKEDMEKLVIALGAKHDLELRYQRHLAEKVAVDVLFQETGRFMK